MGKPITRKFLGGTMKFIRTGDEYKDPNGNVKIYENTKLMVSIAGAPKGVEFPKDAYEALQKFLGEAEIKTHMKDWV